MNRKISAAYVALPEGLVRHSIVEVDEKGVIVNIERNVTSLDSRSDVEYYNGILIAGMVNCHCHLEYSYVKGMIGKGGGMPKFISSIIDIKYNRNVPVSEKIDMARKWDDIMYKNGITAVGDHNNNDYVTDIKLDSKIYYHTFIEMYDTDNQSGEETFYDGVRRSTQQRERGLVTSIVPHATYTLSDELVSLLGGEHSSTKGDTNDKDVISTHFLETVELGGPGEVDRMIGAISDRHKSVLLVHSIYAKREDIEKAKAKFGERVTISPCPLSNIYIEERLADYDMLIESGVRVAIGTDGLSSNDTLSIIEEMKCIQKNYPSIDMQRLIEWATINGAEALCIDSWAGSIEVGKKPGLVLIENLDMQSMRLMEDSSISRIV